MVLIKTLAWIVMYPLVLIGFAAVNVLNTLSFLFNSPVDIWNIISDSIDEAAEQK